MHRDLTRTLASEPGTIVGTASYMSPEQAAGEGEVDGRSDQFALGLILTELITGRKAFDRPTAAETMAAIIREEPAPPACSSSGAGAVDNRAVPSKGTLAAVSV